MTPTIEEEALNTEIQELYLITKQWSADLQFVHDDSDIIKNLSHKALKSKVINRYLVKFNAQEQQLSKLKLKVTHLQKRLEPLTFGPIKKIKLSLIEEHQLLKREMETIILTFRETKNELLEHIAHD